MYIQLTIKNLESIMRTQTIHFLCSLLCMFLLFTLSSCNDETDAVPTWEVFDGHIEQTYWEGTLTEMSDGEVERSSGIKIVFYDKGNGTYTINGHISAFQYSYESKIMSIYDEERAPGSDYSLTKNWWILYFSQDQLQIRTDISDDKNFKQLDLKRVY